MTEDSVPEQLGPISWESDGATGTIVEADGSRTRWAKKDGRFLMARLDKDGRIEGRTMMIFDMDGAHPRVYFEGELVTGASADKLLGVARRLASIAPTV